MSNVREGGLPLFCFDASHSKHPEFSGKHFVLLKKLATNKFVTLCYAIVPSENKMYISWFFYACVKSGVDFTVGVVFVDRGHARAAILLLSKALNIKVNLKYCTIHIIRNFATKFNLKESDPNVRSLIFRLQSSISAAEYIQRATDIENEFGNEAMEYLCKNIHPVNWVVFANNENGVEEMEKLPDWVGSNDSYKTGWPASLFGCRSTNAAEGANNALILNDSRHRLPFESLNLVFEEWSNKEVERALLCRDLCGMDGDYINTTKKIISEQVQISKGYECQIMTMSLNGVSKFVVTRGTSHSRYIIDLATHRCTCNFFQQMKLPCCHVFAAQAFCVEEKISFPEISNFAHEAYLKQNFISSHSSSTICLPSVQYMKLREIKPPAYRKSAGRPRKKARIKSKSETANSSLIKAMYYCSRCNDYGHNKRTCNVIDPGITCVNYENSSYGTTYLGSNISLFSSDIFSTLTQFDADEFKTVLEHHSFEVQKGSVEELELLTDNNLKKDDTDEAFELTAENKLKKDDSDPLSVSSQLKIEHTFEEESCTQLKVYSELIYEDDFNEDQGLFNLLYHYIFLYYFILI